MYLPGWLKRFGKAKGTTINGDSSGRFENELYRYADIHKGQRCFVVGNGPSLNKIDMSYLKDEITIGSNRVYLGFDKWGFHFTYWGIEDLLQIKQSHTEFSQILPDAIVKFVPIEHCHLFQCKNLCPVNFLYTYENYPNFSGSPDVLYLGFTVTYMLLQIAVIMGCNPIYLIGCDYSYNIDKSNIIKQKNGDDAWTDTKSQSHFMYDYCSTGKGIIWNTPKFDKTDAAFDLASKWVKERGIRVLNATPGSKLTFFPMEDYESIFK